MAGYTEVIVSIYADMNCEVSVVGMDYLKIDQFRGIQKLQLKKLSGVNLLLGNNDAGKTLVLETVKSWLVALKPLFVISGFGS